MNLRKLVFLVVAVAASGCSRFFIARPSYAAVKKVAVVEYAINPNFLMGTPGSDEAKPAVAQKNLEIFAKAMGNDWQIMPISEMTANAAYKAAGVDAARGWSTGKDMRFASDAWGDLSSATIPPDVAKKWCEGLGVDAVVAISDTWNVQSSFFQGQTVNDYVINMYDKAGTRAWGDGAFHSQSDQNFGVPPGGAIATEMETWVKANSESFQKAVEGFRAHLASAP